MVSINETIDLIHSFSQLPEGWNFGAGKPSAPLLLLQSKLILLLAYTYGLDEAEAFPGTDGEIQVNLYKDDATLELIFETNGNISVTLDENDTSIRLAKDIAPNKAIKFLKEFEFDKCRSFVSLISLNITVPRRSVLQVWHSVPPPTAVEYQSLRKNAAKSIATVYAHTSKRTMRIPQGRQSSFGKSRMNVYQRAARPSIV